MDTIDCTDGDVRLFGGTSETEGLVKVCYNGGWYSVCGLNEEAASLFCKQLGHKEYPCKEDSGICVTVELKKMFSLPAQGHLGLVMEGLTTLPLQSNICSYLVAPSFQGKTGQSALYHHFVILALEIPFPSNASVSVRNKSLMINP